MEMISFYSEGCHSALADLEARSAGAVEALGFRTDGAGAHTSRPLAIEDLDAALEATRASGARPEDFRQQILDENCLGKKTFAARRAALSHLRRLYGLDARLPLFRVMRDLYLKESTTPQAKAQLALLLGAAREPLLRASINSIQGISGVGAAVEREGLAARFQALGHSEKSARRAAGNVLASWAAAGHLENQGGELRRLPVEPSKEAVAYGLYLGYSCTAARGQGLFARNPWMAFLGGLSLGFGNAERWREIATEAHQVGLLTLRRSGGLVEIDFPAAWKQANREALEAAAESRVADEPLAPVAGMAPA